MHRTPPAPPAPSASPRRLLGVDLGGTAAKAGVLELARDGRARILARSRAAHAGADPASAVTRAAADALSRAGVRVPDGAGFACAAWLDPATGRARASPHLPSLVGIRPAALLTPVLEAAGAAGHGLVPVALNDADAAALAESRLGAARPAPGDLPGAPTLFVALGTGVGGAVIVDGAVLPGARGMHGEAGHICVDPDGPACPCGARGCWELYASASALARTLPGRPIADVLEAAVAGPGPERDAVLDAGEWLGRGLAPAVCLLDPVRVVVGGGLMAAGELLLPTARAALRRALPTAAADRPPELVAAALGNDAGWIGAALADGARV